MKIIGITGTTGAGKGCVVDYLVKNRGFKHYSVREFLIEQMRENNLEINATNMADFANKLREENGPSFIVEQLFNIAKENKEDAIIESIRNIFEVESLSKKENFVLLAVQAKINLRYQRILKRNSELDNVSFEEFEQMDKKQESSNNKNEQSINSCIKKANFYIENNSSLEELYKNIDEILK